MIKSLRFSKILGAFLLFCCGAFGQETKPAAEWGQSQDGLAARIAGDELAVGQSAKFMLSLRNRGTAAADLSQGFAWLFIAQGKERAYFTARVKLSDLPPVGRELAVDKSVDIACDLTQAKVYVYDAALELRDGYPQLADDAKDVGTLAEVLPIGRCRARLMVYVPARKALLTSNTLTLKVDEPEVAKLSGAARKRYIAEVLAGFSRDEFAAQKAHARALKVGGEIVPDLTALLDTKLPGFGQMWVTSALIDLKDGRAVEPLIKMLGRGGGVGYVVAYHGGKMKNDALTKAVDAAAGKDPLVAAWAARGAKDFGGKVRVDLLDKVIAALGQADEKTKARLAEALEKVSGQKFGTDVAKWREWRKKF